MSSLPGIEPSLPATAAGSVISVLEATSRLRYPETRPRPLTRMVGCFTRSQSCHTARMTRGMPDQQHTSNTRAREAWGTKGAPKREAGRKARSLAQSAKPERANRDTSDNKIKMFHIDI